MKSLFSTALSGMNAATTKILNAARNIANISSSGKLPSKTGETTTAFAPQDVVTLSAATGNNALGVTTTTVPRTPSYRPAYDPSSPNADAQGLVAEPAIDITREITDSLTAEIAYKASVKVIEAEKKNEESLLDRLT